MSSEPSALKRPDPYALNEAMSRLAESEAKRARAELAALETRVGGHNVKALEGKLDVDANTQVEADIMAIAALDAVAASVAKSIAPYKHLVLARESDLRALLQYRLMIAQMDIIENAYTAVLEKRRPQIAHVHFGAPLLAGATAVTRGVIDLLSLFRTDTTITGRELVVDDLTFAAQVASHLKKSKLYIPALVALEIGALTMADHPIVGLLGRLEKLQIKKVEARDAVGDLPELERTHALLAEVYETLLGKASTGVVEPAIPDDRFSTLARGASLATILERSNAGLLFLRVVRVVGTTRVEHRLLWRDKLSHSGGAIASFFVVGRDGSVLLANTVYKRIGFSANIGEETTALSAIIE